MARQIILLALSTAIAATSAASSEPRNTGPEKASVPSALCDEFLPTRKQVGGKDIGPDECMKKYKMSPQDYRNQFKINSLPAADLRLSALACPDKKQRF